MKKCENCFCGKTIDRGKDFYVTVNGRKGPAYDFCSIECAAEFVADE